MSSLVKNSLFFVVVAGVVYYAYFIEYKGGEKAEKEKQEQARVFGIESEGIKAIEIATGGSKIALTREGSDWKIVEPMQDEGDSDTVRDFLKLVTDEKSEETVVEGDVVDFQKFGLHEPLGTITVKSLSDDTLSASVGSIEALGGRTYLRRGQEKQVLLAGAAWKTQLERKAKDFRKKQVIEFDKDKISSFKIKNSYQENRETVEVTQKDGKWWAKGIELGKAEVDSFLSAVLNLRANDFVTEDLPTNAERKTFRLDQPLFEAEILIGDQKKTLMVGSADKNYSFVVSSDRKPTLQIFKAAAEALPRTFEDFRDKKRAFQLVDSEIEQISIQTQKVQAHFKRKEKGWELIDGKANGKEGGLIDDIEVDSIISRVRNLKTDKFVGKMDPKLVTPPRGSLVFRNKAGETELEMSWGATFDEGRLTYLKSSKENEIVGVKTSLLELIPQESLFKTAGVKVESEAPVLSEPEQNLENNPESEPEVK